MGSEFAGSDSSEEQGLRLFAEGVVSPRKSILPPPRLTLVPAPTVEAPPAAGLTLVPSRTEPTVEAPPVTPVTRAGVACEREIIAVLDQGDIPGERIADAFRRKELELGGLFASLSVDDARRLHQRLTNPMQDDPIAVRMKRFTADRNARLIAFLADARRRAAVAKGR